MCSTTSNASTMLNVDNRLHEPDGVRKAGGINLSGCHPNRVQATRAAHQIAHDLMSLRLSLAHKLDEEMPDADGYQVYFGEDTKDAKGKDTD
jgi:hypothetical protein